MLVVTTAAALVATTVALAGAIPPPAAAFDRLIGPGPDLEAAVRSGLSEPSRVLAADGSLLGRFQPEERFVPIDADEIPASVATAIVAAEDATFFEHAGIDARAIVRAALADVREGEVSQGGSTITQQVVKNLFTDGSRTLDRKVEEARLAIQLERDHSKREILAAYLNTVFFGEGAIGIRAASRTYFRKPVEQLSLSEAALLAGLIPAPSVYNPRVAPDVAETRRQLVLDRMAASGLASPSQVAAARAERPVVQPPSAAVAAYPYFMDYTRRWLLGTGGVPSQQLYQGGLTIETTLDPALQDAALAAVANHLPDRTGPTASVVVVDPATGAVRALVGGRDWQEERVNLALGRRGGGTGQQPGSSFKPFVLALAYEDGASPHDLIGAPAELPVGSEGHVVHNYSRHGYPDMTIAEATRRSINTSFVSLGLVLGPGRVADFARTMGLQYMPRAEEAGASIAIGAYEVSPLRMASAYGVFAHDGTRVPPRPVTRVVGPDGEVLGAVDVTPPQQVLSVDAARLTTSTLQGVITSGTGRAAAIGRPAAGKTGTTDEYRDAWFVGYTPQLSASVWVGYASSNRPMRDVAGVAKVTGGSIPARIWHDVMTAAHADLPVQDFAPTPDRPVRTPATQVPLPPRSTTSAQVPPSTTSTRSTSRATTTVPPSPTTTTTVAAATTTTTVVPDPEPPATTAPPTTTTTTAPPTTTTTAPPTTTTTARPTTTTTAVPASTTTTTAPSGGSSTTNRTSAP
jgi:penicillin-binding protein 1A